MDFSFENNCFERLCPLCANPTFSDDSQVLPCCNEFVCKDCFRSYIRYRIEDGHYLIPCPMPQCQDELTSDLIDTFGTLKQKHRKELNKIDASNTTTTRSCPNCSHITGISVKTYQLMNKAKSSKKNSNKVNKTICQSCNESWCYFCYGPTHPGVSCKTNMDSNDLFIKWSKDWDKTNQQQNSFKCPGCGIPVQRDGGCPNMSCSRCTCTWCYHCGKSTKKTHILLGSHSGDKWEVNACDKSTLFGSKKITKTLRWFKVIHEVIIFTICGIAILLICFPLLPVLILVVPPVFFLIIAGKELL